MENFPDADFYYKMVAKVDGKFYSIYDADTEYVQGQVKYQKALPNKGGGYYVYKDVKDALFAIKASGPMFLWFFDHCM